MFIILHFDMTVNPFFIFKTMVSSFFMAADRYNVLDFVLIYILLASSIVDVSKYSFLMIELKI